MDVEEVPNNGKALKSRDEDYMYMKALYHALPMDYVTVAKLQTKLDGEPNQTTVRKLIDKMARDGFVESTSNRRLGKRVIHSESTNRKLLDVKKALDNRASAMETNELHNKSNGSNHKDMSTCGGLHSIGSDQTRMQGRSDMQQNGSIRSEQTTTNIRDQVNTPTSRAEPVTSRESAVPPENANNKANGRISHCNEGDNTIICSRSTQDKRSRKASMVKEPILQYLKRQKSQVA